MPLGTLEVLLVDAKGLENSDFLGNYLFPSVSVISIFDLPADHFTVLIVETHIQEK